MKVSIGKRLTVVASMIDARNIADIGCDHGKLGAYLFITGKVDKIINLDISKDSLDKAKKLMANYKECNTICRVSDGCDELLSNEVENVVITGLGGNEIMKILSRAFEENKEYKKYILSPNRDVDKVKNILIEKGYGIKEDQYVEEAGVYYTVFSAERGGKIPIGNEIYYGINFRTDPLFKDFLFKRVKHLEEILKTHGHAEGIEKELQRLYIAKGELVNES